MWTLRLTDEFERRRKRYAKKRGRELRAVRGNLDVFVESLNEGAKPQQAKFGFIHPEPLGVLAIDQKGGGKNLAETRLYVFPDEAGRVLYAITLGDKQSQGDDIETCKQFVRDLTSGALSAAAEPESNAVIPEERGDADESDREELS